MQELVMHIYLETVLIRVILLHVKAKVTDIYYVSLELMLVVELSM